MIKDKSEYVSSIIMNNIKAISYPEMDRLEIVQGGCTTLHAMEQHFAPMLYQNIYNQVTEDSKPSTIVNGRHHTPIRSCAHSFREDIEKKLTPHLKNGCEKVYLVHHVVQEEGQNFTHNPEHLVYAEWDEDEEHLVIHANFTIVAVY